MAEFQKQVWNPVLKRTNTLGLARYRDNEVCFLLMQTAEKQGGTTVLTVLAQINDLAGRIFYV